MVTGSTQQNNWSATLPPEALAIVAAELDEVTTAVNQVMRRYVFENTGKLGAVRNLAAAAKEICQMFYQAMAGKVTNAEIESHITTLVENGLGQNPILVAMDELATAVNNLLPDSETAVSEYRRHALLTYMNAKLQQAARDHEQIYKSFNENLARQVEQERQLRRSLQEEQQNALKRAAGLEMVAHIGTLVISLRDIDELLRRVCERARRTLDLYHVQIYLLDEAGQQVILRGASGDVGQHLLAEKRFIPIDREQSIIAHAARHKEPLISNDVLTDPMFLLDPLLPDTKSELAVPLLSEGELVGVLDVQADQTDVFTENDESLLVTLATTIVVGLENINYFTQSRYAVEEMDVLARRLAQEGWDTYVTQQVDTALTYRYELGEVSPLTEPAAWQTAVTPTKGAHIMDRPLTIYGAEIGRLALITDSDGMTESDEETAEVITSIAQQLAARVENLRLTEETQRALAQTEAQAKRLEAINQVAQTVSEQIELEPMLEAVYTQISTIMKADSFWISFYDPEEDTVHYPVIFEGDHRDYNITRPLTIASSSRTVLNTGQSLLRHMTAEEAAAIQGSAVTIGDTSQDITKSSIFVPLTIGAQGKGVLSVQTYEFNAYLQDDIELLQGIGNYLAVAVENIRLFSETQDRAEQMGAINQLAQAVSQQLDLDNLLDTVFEQIDRIVDVDAFVVGLYDAQTSAINYPIVREGDYRGKQGPIPVASGSFAEQVIKSGDYALRHYTEEEVAALSTTPGTTALGDTEQQHVASTLYVPLKIGTNIIGVMSINSYAFNAYGENEVNLMLGVANFVSVALENVRLFTETQERAAQLEKLSEIERALSQAENETAVVEALALYADEDQAITLQYVEETPNDQPTMAYTIAHWENGELQSDNQYIGKPFRINQHAGLSDGLSRNREIIYINDIAKSPNVSGRIKKEADKLNYGSVAVLPLRSGGRWQGFVTFKWPKPHNFSTEEKLLWQQLREPVAAVVAGRRAFRAQQDALRETEVLYTASAELNRAQSYDDVLSVLKEQTILGKEANNISLNYFDRPWLGNDMPEWSLVLSRWTLLPDETLSNRYPLTAFASAQELLHRSRATIIEDIASDNRLDDNIRALYTQRLGGVSTIFAPLVSGGQWVGYINATYPEPMVFPEEEVRRLLALTGQAAVSIQSIRLLEEATQRARREQLLREITARVRSSTDVEAVMRTAVQEVGRALGRKAFIQLEKKNGA